MKKKYYQRKKIAWLPYFEPMTKRFLFKVILIISKDVNHILLPVFQRIYFCFNLIAKLCKCFLFILILYEILIIPYTIIFELHLSSQSLLSVCLSVGLSVCACMYEYLHVSLDVWESVMFFIYQTMSS